MRVNIKKAQSVATFAITILFFSSTLFAQSTEFTYQGRLLDNALPPTANYDFQFGLWDSLVAGTQQGSTQTITGVAVANGIFTVKLNFGAQFFGPSRFLQIEVRPAGGGAYTTLAPRQPFTSAPYSIRSLNSAGSDSLTAACNLCVTDAHIQSMAGNKLTGVITGDGSGITNINGGNITNNTVTSTQLSAEAVPNSTAYKLLGSLRWDLLKPQANFPVGGDPSGVAFDGANIWVVNNGSNNVTKLRASDGANLGTFTVGNSPRGVAFDGANIWVTNSTNFNNVTKLRASDGANLGTFTAGTDARAVAFDGANIWVANLNSGNVTKLRASDGANLGNFAVGSFPFAVAFDGANIWVANSGNANVTKLRASDGANLGNFAVGTTPVGLAFDGANIWVANLNSGNVTKLRASDGVNFGTFNVGGSPLGLAFDGANIWVSNNSGTNVTKLRASDGANLGNFGVGTFPIGVAFDGANIWVANNGSFNVTRLFPAFPQP